MEHFAEYFIAISGLIILLVFSGFTGCAIVEESERIITRRGDPSDTIKAIIIKIFLSSLIGLWEFLFVLSLMYVMSK